MSRSRTGARPTQWARLGDRSAASYDAKGYGDLCVLRNVAVIPVEGTLVHKGAFLGQSSGETSYQGLQTQVARAARDPNVKAWRSRSTPSAARSPARSRRRDDRELSAIKPTLAILTDNALSAGYLMASAARQIVMPEDGRAGSIGVITMHVDYSQKLEKDGIKVTIWPPASTRPTAIRSRRCRTRSRRAFAARSRRRVSGSPARSASFAAGALRARRRSRPRRRIIAATTPCDRSRGRKP
jgi:hypothetical protein